MGNASSLEVTLTNAKRVIEDEGWYGMGWAGYLGRYWRFSNTLCCWQRMASTKMTSQSTKSKKRRAEDTPPAASKSESRRGSSRQKRIKALKLKNCEVGDAGNELTIDGIKGKMVTLPRGSWEARINSISNQKTSIPQARTVTMTTSLYTVQIQGKSERAHECVTSNDISAVKSIVESLIQLISSFMSIFPFLFFST